MKNLKALRQSKGLSQLKLAEQFNISQQSIYKYENGLAEPDFDTLISLANYFDTSVDYLIGRSDSPNIEHVTVELPLTSNDISTVLKFSRLNERHKRVINEMIDCLYEKEDINDETKQIKIKKTQSDVSEHIKDF